MYFVAINGGGTKTEAILLDGTGSVLRKETGDASSATALHASASISHLNALLDRLTAGCKENVTRVWAGISGANENAEKHDAFSRFLSSYFGEAAKIIVTNDMVNAFRSVVLDGEGIVANVSTGSSVFCVGNTNEIRQVGGWGYLVGDEGSAFDLGRRALTAVLRQYDGRGGKTVMTEMIREASGKQINELISDIYRGGRNTIAGYADILLNAAEKNDRVALHHLEEAASGIADAIRTGGGFLGCSLVRVVLSGAMWEKKIYYDAVDRCVGRNYQMLIPRYTKLTGAALMVLKTGNVMIDKAMTAKIGAEIGSFNKS